MYLQTNFCVVLYLCSYFSKDIGKTVIYNNGNNFRYGWVVK